MRRSPCVFALLLIAMLMLPASFIPNNGALFAVPTNVTIVNLALQKPATQSSIDSGNSADRAVDGDRGSFAQTLSEVHPWWQVDLGEISYIDNIQITTRADCCANDTKFVYVFTSEVPFVSNDLDATRNQPEVATETNVFLFGMGATFPLDLQRTARYIRIQVQTLSATNLYLAEVQVMGVQVPNNPGVAGQWSTIPPLHNSVDTASIGHTWNTLSLVHLSLLPSKKLLFWGRDKLQTSTGDKGWFDDSQGGSDAYVWDMTKLDDPNTPQDERLTLVRNDTTNLFCAGHSFLANGNLFVAGGDSIPLDNTLTPRYDLDGHGVIQTNIFDWKQETWITGLNMHPNMHQPRWYPSVVTLSTGETLIISGSFVTFSQASNNYNAVISNQDKDTEIFGRDGTLQRMNDLPLDLPNYPFAHVGPDGTPFVVSGRSGSALFYNPSTGSWLAQPNLNLAPLSHDQGTSVMYDRGKIMVIGGSQGNSISRNTDTIDLNVVNPQWSPGIPMHFARYYATSVLMPDGEIFIVGGSKCIGNNNLQTEDGSCRSGAVMYPEIYDPVSQTWSIMSRQQTVRMYHSVALLLPDARILVAGGGRPGAFGESTELKYLAHHEVEIFSPPYLFNADGTPATRPVIIGNSPTSNPLSVGYGQSFDVGVGNLSATQIQQVVLVRLPSVTHALNFDQRRVVLVHQALDQQTIRVTAPPNGAEAPPGPYMLFVIGPNGVPSIAEMILFANILPSVSITSGGNSVYGETVNFIAHVNGPSGSPAPTGTVTFLDGNQVLGAGQVDGSSQASLSTSLLTAATHSITASYSGDSVFLANSAQVSQVVAKAALQVTCNNKTRMYGEPNPLLDGTIAVIQNADNIQVQCSTTANAQSLVGTYPITPTLSDPSGRLGNYTVASQNGTLTVTRSNIALAAPTFSLANGTYPPGTSVTITEVTSSTAMIHYTTDGSNPTASSPLYTGSLVLNATTSFKAMATQPEYLDSSVRSAFYTVGIPISATPVSQTLLSCASVSYTVSVPATNGISGSLAFSVSGLPAGATGSFSPSTINSAGSSTLTVTTSPATPTGSYTLTILVSNSALTGSTNVSLVVQDFNLSASPSSQTVTAGTGAAFSLSGLAVNGFSGSVGLSLSGLPAGASGTFSPASFIGAGASTLTVATSTSTPVGSYPLTVTGSSGCRTHTLPLTLIVNAALPPPAITSLSISAGRVGTAVTISGVNFGATQGASSVTFNGTAAQPVAWSATSISVTVPRGAKTGNVVVTAGGQASNGVAFTVQDDALHILGVNCAGCGNQVTDFTVQSSPLYGYVIEPGDVLSFYQMQSAGIVGGMILCFANGEGLCDDDGSTVDREGRRISADTIQGVTHFREVDLTSNAGSVLSQIQFTSSGATQAGRWDIFYGAVQIVSADGTVHPIFMTGGNPGLFPFGTEGVTQRGSTIEPAHVW